MVCFLFQELGITFIEQNASDKRSQSSLSWLRDKVAYHNLDGFVLGERMVANKNGKPTHCLIMDEVDGMAGNEDRGGVQVMHGLC